MQIKVLHVQNRLKFILDTFNDIVRAGRAESYRNALKLLLNEYIALRGYIDILHEKRDTNYFKTIEEIERYLVSTKEDAYGNTMYKEDVKEYTLRDPYEFSKLKNEFLS